MALPRIALAVLLAVVISKPLELKIFEKEIQAELILMEQELFKQQEDRVKDRFTAQIAEQRAQIESLKTEIALKSSTRDTLVKQAVPADGTGGSKKKNLGLIYLAKKAEADKAAAELSAILALNQPQILAKEQAIQAFEQNISQTAALERSRFNGFAARIDALSRLSTKSAAMMYASLFIMLLFIAIETAPVLVKLISYRSPYDYLLQEHEHVFEMVTLESTTLRNNAVGHKLKYDTETGAYLSNARILAEKALIDQKLKEKLEELKNKPFDWKIGSFGNI